MALNRKCPIFSGIKGIKGDDLVAGAKINVARPRVLVVIAHPDDQSVFSVTLYKIAKEHKGMIDKLNEIGGLAKCDSLFNLLHKTPYLQKVY